MGKACMGKGWQRLNTKLNHFPFRKLTFLLTETNNEECTQCAPTFRFWRTIEKEVAVITEEKKFIHELNGNKYGKDADR
jgi:hypothetical protein